MPEDTDVIALTVDVVSAFVGHNSIRPDDLPSFIAATHSAIVALGQPSGPAVEETGEDDAKPAVSSRKSLASKDHIISMIDGKPYKTLRRHLATHGMTPESYRTRYKLTAAYPMVAENYSETRRLLARKIGLGRKPAAESASEQPAAVDAPAPAKRGRKPRAAAPAPTEAPAPAKRGRKPKPKAEPAEA